MAVDNVLVITGGAGGMGLACARALADRGLTGIVVASGVLDQLTRLQAATRSALDSPPCDGHPASAATIL